LTFSRHRRFLINAAAVGQHAVTVTACSGKEKLKSIVTLAAEIGCGAE
jgi:hypothetical protein